jgi:hypothetical protein
MAMAEARVADAPHPQSQGRSSSAAALGQPATQAMEKALAGTTNEPRARFRLKGVGARDSSAAQQGPKPPAGPPPAQGGALRRQADTGLPRPPPTPPPTRSTIKSPFRPAGRSASKSKHPSKQITSPAATAQELRFNTWCHWERAPGVWKLVKAPADVSLQQVHTPHVSPAMEQEQQEGGEAHRKKSMRMLRKPPVPSLC